MPDEITTTDPKGQSTETTVPAAGQPAGQTTTVQTSTTDDLPEKFKGKTAGEIAKSYIDLESKLGKDGEEKKTLKKQLEDHQALAMVIKGNPELEKAVLAEIDRVSGKQAPSQSKTETTPQQPVHDDTRLAVEGDVIGKFEDRFGINRLDSDSRKDLYQKITNELGDMLDPLGTKTPREVLNSIPLNKLGKYLDKAYQLATLGDAKEQGRVKGLIEARQNSEATFGSIPGTGASNSSRGLTAEQKKVAANMGISEDKYLKNLQEMEEGK